MLVLTPNKCPLRKTRKLPSQNDSKKKNPNGYGIDAEKYASNLEEVVSKNLNNPEMLSASVNNIIHPEDSVIYYPKNAHLISNKYPVYPLRLKEDILKNFADDTLFFMFFEQPNAISKEMAKKELINRGWMFNTSYNSFFKLKKEKEKNKEYIEGDFDFLISNSFVCVSDNVFEEIFFSFSLFSF